MQKYLLFVDTETSGIPQSLGAPIADLDNWPFTLQVAWRVYDNQGNLVKTENHFIYNEDIFIQKSSIKIHGITEEELKAKGEDRKYVMRLLSSDLRHYKPLIVGHFVEFDSKMLQVAMFRSGIKNIVKDYPHFCTMRATSEYSRFPNHNYPKLEELYQGLFGERMIRNHDASVDVEATAKCFFELLRKHEIDDQLIESQPLFVKMREKMNKKVGCGLPVLLFLFIFLGLLLILT